MALVHELPADSPCTGRRRARRRDRTLSSANGSRSPSATSNRPASPCWAKLALASAIADSVRSTPDDLGAAFGKPREIHAGAAADLEHRSAAPAVKVHEPQQVVKLFEVILIEVVEEAARADRMPRDLEIVDVPFPVFANLVDGSHGETITNSADVNADL